MLSEHFAKFLSNRHQPSSKDFYHLVRQLSEAVEAGSSCLHLKNHKRHSLSGWRDDILQPDAELSTVCSPNGHAPLVLTEQGHLYLQRYYLHELGIFEKVSQWITQPVDSISAATKKQFNILFPEQNDQAQAAETALKRRFSIISGGPGTGKTTTVLKILMLLREQGYYSDPTDVLLLAPTGKAADRLKQSILGGIADLGELPLDLPHESSTIHRTLGFRPGTIEFRHNAANPLSAKVVVIDESSMVDLPLMHRLLDAIPSTARIMLLGDKNQLASVQVGTVLSDMMEAAESSKTALKECSVTLRKSYRTQGPINATCAQIKDGNEDAAWAALTSSTVDEIGATIHQELPRQLRSKLAPFVERHWLPILKDNSLTPEQKLTGIDRFRILCPTHNGPYGIAAINQAVEQILTANGFNTQQVWYPGRSIIIQQNDHALGVYNGDTGLVLSNDEDDAIVHFSSADELRSFAPSRLPEAKTAWALTIHRTQGSEYDHILLVIPPAEDSQILSRELLYTGLSRAKKSATVWCSEKSFKDTIKATVQRASGLTAMFNKT